MISSLLKTRPTLMPMVFALSLLSGLSVAQTSAPAPNQTPPTSSASQAASPSQAAAAKARRKAAQRAAQNGTGTLQTIPIETAPPSPQAAQPTVKQQQKADEKLLERQEAQSDKAAAVNDQQVQRAQQRQDTLQNEQRIQDAPGPPQAVPTQGSTAIPPFQSVDPSQLPQPGQTVVPAPNTPVPPR